LTTSLKAKMEINHLIASMILLRIYGQYDFWKDVPHVVGLAVDIGSLTL